MLMFLLLLKLLLLDDLNFIVYFISNYGKHKTSVCDGEFIPVQNQFPQPPAEPSDDIASHSSGNGYKATPVNYSIIYMIQRL